MSSSAEILDDAARRHRSIEPFGSSLGRAPYEVQGAVVARRARRLGSERIGYKVALTSPATQAALRTNEPATGRLLTADVLPTGSTVALESMFSPVLEAELVFRVREDLPVHASPEQIAQGCEVTAGLECPDSRYADWFGGEYPVLALGDVIADNCLTGLVVVGSTWLAVADVDLATVRATLLVDDEEVASGTGAEVLGNPLRSMAWLSAHLADAGETLTAGTVVSAGTLTPPVVARRGTVRGVFSAGLGEASVRFT
jgi:2-keto-4-pentenoate hydratase